MEGESMRWMFIFAQDLFVVVRGVNNNSDSPLIPMKSQHQRNSSLLHDKHKPNLQTHRRSFSFSRYFPSHHSHHNRNLTHLQTNLLAQGDPLADSITLPMSTEIPRDTKYLKKIPHKESSQFLTKYKKELPSKDKQSNSRKKKGKNELVGKIKKSNEKGDKSFKKGSKELLKNKKSLEKGRNQPSGDKKYVKTTDVKSNSHEKMAKTDRIVLEKSNGKRKTNRLDVGVNCQDIIQQLSDILKPSQIAEIKQYKWIYFLGKIKERRKRFIDTHKQPLSARQQRPSAAQQEEETFYLLNHVTERQYEDCDTTERFEAEDEFYKYELGDHIAYRYQIIESINQGSFGEVIRVFDHKLQETLALKIVKKCQQLVQQTFLEISILTHIKQKDKSNLSGVVRIKDFTIFRNHICIVFELLDGNLYELLAANNYNGLGEDVIRIFAVQILNSLNFLQRENIIHCDLKPENIVMKTWAKSGVKLVDFGTSCFDGKQIYEYLQSRYYRAPEIMLRRPYSFPIDMWSFGCLMAELKIGEPIFAGSDNTEQLMYIANSIGYPQEKDGQYSQSFLNSNELKEIIAENYIAEYHKMDQKGEELGNHRYFVKCKYIRKCMKTIKERLDECKKDKKEDDSFLNFLHKILVWQPERRMKPQQALQDPWILKGLPTEIKELYTIFNSVQYSKQSKPKSKESKQASSKKKSSSKKSKQRQRIKEVSGEHKKESKSNEWKFREEMKMGRPGPKQPGGNGNVR